MDIRDHLGPGLCGTHGYCTRPELIRLHDVYDFAKYEDNLRTNIYFMKLFLMEHQNDEDHQKGMSGMLHSALYKLALLQHGPRMRL